MYSAITMEVGGLIRSTKISSSCCYNNNNKQAAESSQVLQHKLGTSSSGGLVVSQTAASSIPTCLHKGTTTSLTRKPCLHQAGQGLRSRISKREQSAAMGAKSATMQRAFILPGARADYHNTDTLKDEQVKSGQPGQQVGHSVPSQMLLNTNEAPQSNDAAAMQAWKDEISLFVGANEAKWEDAAWVQAQIDRRCVDNMRMLTVDSVDTAKAGHPGLPMGLAEVGYVLWRHAMKYNPRNANWFNRDRFVLSAGHGCLLQYICLHLAGYDSIQIEDLKQLCKLGSRTPGHPENVTTAGIEVTTGPLGQGVANAVGMAVAEKHLAARFNKPDAVIVDHHTYCIMGDGCSMEGISNEAASLAAHWKLNKLTVIYDDNHNTIDGDTSLALSEDVGNRFEALGWNRIIIPNIYDDMDSFKVALLSKPTKPDMPTFIQVKTRIGRMSVKENTAKAHHGTFDEEDVRKMQQKLHWNNREPFYVIPQVYEEFTKNSKHGMQLEAEWNDALKRYTEKYPKEAEEFQNLLNGNIPSDWDKVLPSWSEKDPVDATRGYSEKCLNAAAEVLPGIIGGSADLASSNKVYMKNSTDFQHDSPEGRNIRYGIREHAMAGISNGLALHGSGLIPIAATFLIFSDYMKNAMRLSALSEAGVIYILTHDSIGLGEDGPTHQPVEQLVGLRAIPDMYVLRPADGNEVAGAYRVAISRRHAPTVLSLSRQKVEANLSGTSSESVAKGGYIVSDNSSSSSSSNGSKEVLLPEIILIGTGSELALCEKAAETLRKEGRKVRVVSLVCWELFDQQPKEYRDSILPPTVLKRLSVEAGSPIGWREYVGSEGKVFGVYTFGCSGGYLDVFKKYGFTDNNVAEMARSLLA